MSLVDSYLFGVGEPKRDNTIGKCPICKENDKIERAYISLYMISDRDNIVASIRCWRCKLGVTSKEYKFAAQAMTEAEELWEKYKV